MVCTQSNIWMSRCLGVLLIALGLSGLDGSEQSGSSSSEDSLSIRAESSSSSAIDDALRRQFEGLRSPVSSRRVETALSLGRPGPRAKEVSLELALLLKDSVPAVRIAAAKALRRIGPDARGAIPALIDALFDENYEVSVFVKSALLEIVSPQAVEAVPLLIDVLRSDATQPVVVAEQALIKIGEIKGIEAIDYYRSQRISPVVRRHLSDLKDPQSHVRKRAIQRIGDMGPDAKAAIPALIEFLRSGKKEERMWAGWALEQMGPVALPELLKAMQSRDSVLQRNAAQVLSNINTPEARDAFREFDEKQTRRITGYE